MTALAESIPRPRGRSGSLAVDAALVVGGSLFIALFAQITIPLPFTPIPISGQTFAVLLLGTAYGWRLGLLTLALYLGQIAVGLPFAAEAKSGLEVLSVATASGGYLWGMLVAAGLTGFLANRGWDRNVGSALAVMVLGNLVIYAFGVPWLMASIDVPFSEAISLGVTPFLIGDAVKVLLAAGLLPAAWRLVGRKP
jgi:biotin transport system substrate-specific component